MRREKRVYAMPRPYVALGAFLQEARNARKLTQRVVSLKLGYSTAQFISNFECGISRPPLKKLQALVKLYRIPTDTVVDRALAGERVILKGALQ